MREEDAHAIAARLGSYERTCSTEVPRFRSVGRQSEEMMPKPAKKVKTHYVFVSACALPCKEDLAPVVQETNVSQLLLPCSASQD